VDYQLFFGSQTMKNKKPDAALVWKQLEDDLTPRLGLNLGDRVVYAHLVRHSRLAGKTQLRFSIRRLAFDAHLSYNSARHAVRRLIAKGALRLIERAPAAGHVVEVRLPNEALAAVSEGGLAMGATRRSGAAGLEQMNFLHGKTRRDAIHARDRGLCFYCLSRLTPTARCLDHVVPAARGGTNSYRNLVSCCVECNTQKGETVAEDFRRSPDAKTKSRLEASATKCGAPRRTVRDHTNRASGALQTQRRRAGWKPALRKGHDMSCP
jgi:HNH endonuclease